MIVALNNKCNLTKKEFIEYQIKLQEVKTTSKLILCPSFLYLDQFNLTNIKLGAQNVSTTDCGAYTGEVSAKQLKEENVDYCIVGHSERREYQQEKNAEINEKIKRLFSYQITPILCVGEKRSEREEGLEKQVILKELTMATKDLTEEEKGKVIIAYEPIWSIGTGLIPTAEQIIEIIHTIKEIFPQNKVLYGGSANEENIDTLKEIPEIDGYLLGGLSLKPEKLQIFLEKLEK